MLVIFMNTAQTCTCTNTHTRALPRHACMSGASLDRRCRASRGLTLAVLTRSHGLRPSPCLGLGEDGWAPGVTSPRTATFTGLPGQSSRGQVPPEARVLAPWSPRPAAGPGAAAASPLRLRVFLLPPFLGASPSLFLQCRPTPLLLLTEPCSWAGRCPGQDAGGRGAGPLLPKENNEAARRGGRGAWSHIRASEVQPPGRRLSDGV